MEKESPCVFEFDTPTAHTPIVNSMMKTKINLLMVSSGSF
jgi:hypothetical protein